MPMNPTSVVVKYRTVSITVFPWSHRPGATYWKFHHGKKTVVRNTLEKAKAEAKRIAEETFLGTASLGNLTDAQIRGIRRMIEVDPTLAGVDDYVAWCRRARPRKLCGEAVAEFVACKEGAAGLSRRNVGGLKGHLAALPNLPLADIRPGDLPPLTGAPRSRANRRNAWVTFFAWCREMEYLPFGAKTAPEKLDAPVVVGGIPATYTPDELRILLDNVSPEYLGWLACSAFAGIRNSELSPVDSDKPPLDWSDFAWDRMLLIVRPETSKTGRRRVIPIVPALAAWLRPVAQMEGRVCPERNPSHETRREPAETARLGALIGGWKPNALRHSFISYRAAVVGIAQGAQEAGNSEAISRRAYQDAMGADVAAEWFGVLPVKYPRLVVSDVSPVSEKPEKSRKVGT